MRNDLAVLGGTVVHRDRTEVADVIVRAGTVVEVGQDLAAPQGAPVVDASGLLVCPGFVDLQLNGAHGIDLAAKPERLWDVAGLLAQYGVTSFLPTIITSPPEIRKRALEALRCRPDDHEGAEPLGLHFEGPMLNPARKGVHPSAWLRPPSAEVVAGWTADAGVALVTLAPELPGGLEAVRRLVAGGVVVSAGHTSATAEELDRAAVAGLTGITHLFNAMTPFNHRNPGPIGFTLADPRVTAGIIADGIHVHPLAVAAAWKALGPDRLVLVTDAVAALGQPFGRFRLGDQQVTLGPDGVRLPDGTLAGSALAMDQAVRNLVAFTGCDLPAAVATVTATPARLLGRGAKGSLGAGSDADLTLLTPDLQVVRTIVAGRHVFHTLVR